MDPAARNSYTGRDTMNNQRARRRFSRGAVLGLACLAAFAAAPARAMWVTAYYTGWRQSRLKPDAIDYGAVTHLMHFAVVPRSDGTLDAGVNMMTPANVSAAVAAAHQAGKKILFTVGGQGSRPPFIAAIGGSKRGVLISALVKFLDDNGYDGIDVDMEPVEPGDARAFGQFLHELRVRLDERKPRPLLTAAALWEPSVFARAAADLDQINLMSYNLSGPYPGWVVWHSGSMYDGGRRFPNGKGLPSVDGVVQSFLAAGVPRSKLGVGLSFNGYVWSGGEVSRPGQKWSATPMVKNVPYYVIADTYRLREGEPAPSTYHWDDEAQAAYLSVEGAAPSDAQFVSFDDERTADRMARYARGKGLGGMFIWDLGAGYRAEQPEGRRDALLQAVKRAAAGSAETL